MMTLSKSITASMIDGDAPHTPRGCVAQAWSVAGLLRAAVEDLYATKELPVATASARGA